MHVLVSLGAAATGMLFYAGLLVLPPAAWLDSRYVVPALGVVLSGAIGSVGAGLAALVDELMNGGCLIVSDIIPVLWGCRDTGRLSVVPVSM